MTLHFHHLNSRVLLYELFNVAVAAANTNDKLAIEDLCRDLFAAKLVLTLILPSEQLSESCIIDENCKHFIENVSLDWNVLFARLLTPFDFHD